MSAHRETDVNASPSDEPTLEALRQAKRHIGLAEAHERKVAQHEEWAAFHDEKGETERAEAERRKADLERDAARDEWDRADAIQGPTQFTQPKKGEPVVYRDPDARGVRTRPREGRPARQTRSLGSQSPLSSGCVTGDR